MFHMDKTKHKQKSKVRLFLVSDEIFSDIEETDVLHGYRTDHSMI